MSYIRDTVFVLKSEPFREHDARVTMYGRDHGKLVAVARGMRRMGAKQLGHLEPLSEARVMIASGQAFDKLAVAQRVGTEQAQGLSLRRNLAAMAVLGPLADLVEQLTRPGVPERGIYELLREGAYAWSMIGRMPTPERGRIVLACASLRLLDLLGEAPDFSLSDYGTPSDGAMTLLRFMRVRPLADMLAITAPAHVFNEASALVEGAVERSPLVARMHGPATVHAVLA